MSDPISSETALREHYQPASDGALGKQLPFLDFHCKSFVERSPFVCIGTARQGALPDVSPRGGEPGFVQIADDRTLLLPDLPGNNRLDTLTNVAESGAVGLLFFVPGFNEMLRVNGRAEISMDDGLLSQCEARGRKPRSVLVVTVEEAYLHCTKALVRSDLWNSEKHFDREEAPTFGAMLRDQMKLDAVPAEVIDEALKQDEKDNLY